MNRAVLISLFSGNAVSGVLVKQSGRYLMLRDCTVHEPGSGPAKADGEVAIDEANVDYVQILAQA